MQPHDNTSSDVPLRCCKRCTNNFPATTEYFHRSKLCTDGLYYYCKTCVKHYHTERRAAKQPIRITEKRCDDCGIVAPIGNFYRDSHKGDGYENICKRCNAQRRGAEFREPPPPTTEGDKWCRRCGEIKPLREFHWKRKHTDGHCATCKECLSKRGGWKYRPSAEPGFKRCACCKNEFPANIENFYNDKSVVDGYSSHCRPCTKAKSSRWRQANPERSRQRKRFWGIANPDALQAARDRRRTLERNAEGTHTRADVKRQYEAQKGKCYYCGCALGDKYHTDHVIPLSRGGSNGPENIVVACALCNSSKGNKLPHEWMGSNRLL